jgi:hypothetical protein
MQRVRMYEAIDFSRWIGACKLETPHGEWYECYWLKLPSYGYHYCIMRDQDEWCQLIWFWHGRDGFSYFWQPVPDQP